MWKMDPMSDFDIHLVFTLPPRDSTLQYKRCVHLWNNFPCITTLQTLFWYRYTYMTFRPPDLCTFISGKLKNVVLWEIYLNLWSPPLGDQSWNQTSELKAHAQMNEWMNKWFQNEELIQLYMLNNFYISCCLC